MHTFLFAAGLFLTVLYIIFVLSLYLGLTKLKPGTISFSKKVSVVVAARNEEKRIASCVEALLLQDYPKDLFDIIVVNDRSEDKTLSILEKYEVNYPSFKIVNINEIPSGFAPKKYALTKGIEEAKGEIICTTDADCVPPPTWVSEMVSYFDEKTGFVAGFSPLYSAPANGEIENSIPTLPHQPPVVKRFSKIFLIDFLYMDSIGLATASAGGIGLGIPWTCAGRNLAYRKSAFNEIGGFDDVKSVISGDDDLLMLGINKNTNWQLRYAIGKKSAVPSFDDANLNSFVDQRTRHSSKFFVHPLRLKIASAAIFMFYCAFIIFPFYMIFSWQFLTIFPIMAGSKFIVELLTTSKGARLFGAQFRFASFLKSYFIHPFVIVLFGILGSRGKITWKGREFFTSK